MSRTSTSRIRFWAAIGSLFVPVAVALAASVAHATASSPVAPGSVLAPAVVATATFTPAPNCPTSAPSDGNENTGFGDLGNENPGNCDIGNGNTTNNVDGNANGSGADLPGENSQCPDPEKSKTTC